MTFTTEQRDANAKALSDLVQIIPSIRSSMVRRFRRATAQTQCYFISQYVLNDGLVAASSIAQLHRPVVSWLVPNTQNPASPFHFCFSVKEVQRHIATYENKSDIPMFGLQQMTKIVKNSNIEIATTMPHEFRFVIEEFDFLPMGQEILKEDKITVAAINAVESYVKDQNQQYASSSSSSSSYVGNFWKWTKDYLVRTGEKLLSYVLGSPWWTTVIQFLAKIIRLVICAGTSLVTKTVEAKKTMLELLKKTFEQQMRIYSFFPKLIIEFAQALLPTFFQKDEKLVFTEVSQDLQKSSLFVPLGHIARKSFHAIMDQCGVSYLITLPQLVFSETTSIFDSFLNVAEEPELQFQDFYGSDLDVFGVVSFLDAMMAHLEPDTQKEFIQFSFGLFPTSNKALKDSLDQVVNKALFTWISFMKSFLQYPEVQAWLRELYFWILDIVPCLFHFFVRNLRSFLTIRVTALQTVNAACCLRDVVMDLQKTAVIYGTERGKKEQADAERKLGESGKKTEKSWIEYLLTKPFSINQTTTEQEQSFQTDVQKNDEWVNNIAPYLSQEETKTKGQTAAAHTMRAKQDALWVGQCTQDDDNSSGSHLFPNPISVFQSKLPFYFERHVTEPQRFCVTPSSDVMRKLYPRAVWKWKGQQYVMLHLIPSDVVHHMAKMQTPVFALSAFE